MDLIKNIFSEMIKISSMPSKNSPIHLLKILQNSYPLKAISFYSYEPYNQLLILKEQIGLEYSLFRKYERYDKNSFPVRTIDKQEIVTSLDVKRLLNYEEPELARELDLKLMLAIPLIYRNGKIDEIDYNGERSTIKVGVLFVYPEDGSDIIKLKSIFQEIEPFFTQVYIQSMKVDKLEIRRQLFENAVASKDINSFLHRALGTTLKFLKCEAGSVFLWDEKSNLLKLHATTGLDTDLKKADIYYRRDEQRESTKVALSGVPLLRSTIELISTPPGKYNEKVSGETKSFAFLPILNLKMGEPLKAEPLGVLRIVNKKAQYGNNEHITSFTWEDVSNLRFVSELMSSIIILMRSSEHAVEYFDKIMHGARSNIEAVIQNLQHLRSRPQVIEIHDKRYNYIMPNSISHLLDVKWQIERLESWDKEFAENLVEVKIMGDVLSKIVSLATDLAPSLNVETVQCTNLIEANFHQLPTVKGNIEALQIVFRNLIENALKYSQPNSKICKIDFQYEIDTEYLYIKIIDYGLGIEREIRDWVFIEGYRGEKAIRRTPAGGGMGLAHSKKLMSEMGGEIYLGDTSSKTEFIVKIPLWEKEVLNDLFC